MITKYIELKEESECDLREAGDAIKRGKLVVFPTETVYGIGANALNIDSVARIFEAKGRASDNPLIVHISNIDMLKDIVCEQNEIEKKLIRNFWPGPLTIIMKKKEIIPYNVSGGLETVGVRMPNNKYAQKLIEYAGVPIAAPSANKSGKPSGTLIQDIKKELDGKVEYILDAGNSEIGLESTVVQVIDKKVRILRPGKITLENIKEKIGLVEIDEHVLNPYEGNEKVLSPGMKYTHYAPKTKCILVYSNDSEKLVNKINELSLKNDEALILGRTENLDKYNAKHKLDIGNSLEEIAHNIFRRLREVDKYNVKLVVIEGVEDKGLGLAIMNRLLRACGYRYIKL